jgi:fumarate reductase subunit D
MTMWNNKAFTENEMSLFGKAFVIIAIVVPVIILVVRNVLLGHVDQPYAFAICIIGFFCFLISKLSLFRKGVLFSFGRKRLSENMGNLYRIGYWLMAFGLVMTFL